jgi:hypothetical protein
MGDLVLMLVLAALGYWLGRLRAGRTTEEITMDAAIAALERDARTDVVLKATKLQAAGTATTADVKAAWSQTWARVSEVFPDFEARLALLSKRHPIQTRRLGRVAASAGRWSGRVLRGEGQLRDLELRLRVFERVVLHTLETHNDQH